MTVLHGDCLEVMPTLDASSVDSIVTDPPYGLAFMGKAWDHGVPGVEFWEAAYRVAKPGAHLVAFGGTRTYHRLTVAIEDAGWEIRDCLSWLYGSGFPKSHNGPWGGTALKPAWEPIILARKPLVGTVAAHHARHGTGALNIDGCRIPSEPFSFSRGATALGRMNDDNWQPKPQSGENHPAGRWPANVVLDEEAAAALDEQGGDRKAGGNLTGAEPSRPALNTYGEYNKRREWQSIGDSGGASRFFYTAKASRAERNAGLEGMAEVRVKQSGHVDQRVWDIPGSHAKPRANHHPTVKPLDLMQWLCRLVTPKGGLILDPFCGSGTTGRAAVAEGFRFVGIEKEAEYVEIARARIAEYAPLFAPACSLCGGDGKVPQVFEFVPCPACKGAA